MIIEPVWLTKMVLAHLLTDFILQPGTWVAERNRLHFRSPKLYLHGLVTSLVAWVLVGGQYWGVALIILITHTLIDGWKSYQPPILRFFLIDQLLHFTVIIACWLVLFVGNAGITHTLQYLNKQAPFWQILTAVIFLTLPAGILIGQFTRQWRDQIPNSESLANAGKWIGMAERIIILIFVLNNQYSAIGLLVAAKGIIRFNEKERPEVKTEYLVVGTLTSIGLAIVTGLLVKG